MYFDQQILVYAGAALATFLIAFLRGFQNKSVAGGHKWMAFIGGGAMTALENTVTIVLAHQLGDYFILVFTSMGSAFGWVAGMIVHDALMWRRTKEARKAKKNKRQSQLDAKVAELLDEKLREHGLI